METYTGKPFSLVAPDPDSVDIRDIAVHLSRIPRFVGATRFPYSVAQHSVHVMQICKDASPRDYIAHLWGLLHDAHEAYIGDLSTPFQDAIRLALPRFTPDPIEEIKNNIDRVIAKHFGIDWSDIEAVKPFIKRADMIALSTEKVQLMEPCEWQLELPEPCAVELLHVGAGNAEWVFRKNFEDCLAAYQRSRPAVKAPVKEAAE
jgi:hypothetical protein